MSIFPGIVFQDFTVANLQTAAPMTVTGLSQTLAKFAISGGVVFVVWSISFTIGGTLAAQVIEIDTPIFSSTFATTGHPMVATISNGGAVNVSRGRWAPTNNRLGVFKSNGVADIAWAAGATTWQGSGFYYLS